MSCSGSLVLCLIFILGTEECIYLLFSQWSHRFCHESIVVSNLKNFVDQTALKCVRVQDPDTMSHIILKAIIMRKRELY